MLQGRKEVFLNKAYISDTATASIGIGMIFIVPPVKTTS